VNVPLPPNKTNFTTDSLLPPYSHLCTDCACGREVRVPASAMCPFCGACYMVSTDNEIIQIRSPKHGLLGEWGST